MNKPFLEIADAPKRDPFFQKIADIRAKVLYTLDPVGISIWKRMKSPLWWFLELIQHFPFYGIQTMVMLFYFTLMEKTDEFQLVKYIVSFKKLQFVTIGCLNGLVAYIKYFICISTRPSKEDHDHVNACSRKGKADSLTYFIQISTFIIKIALIWACYFMLPFSKKIGQPCFRIRKLDDSGKLADNAKTLPV